MKNRKLPHVPKEERISFNISSNNSSPFISIVIIAIILMLFTLLII